jgi:hypothetical protein
MSDKFANNPRDNKGRVLYLEGDDVDVELLLYPGPREFKTVGEVVECLSPTYYVVAYVDHKGILCHKRFMRSQLR